jgi:Type II secretion system (T2SS), protein K
MTALLHYFSAGLQVHPGGIRLPRRSPRRRLKSGVSQRRGMLLIIVLIVIAMLSLGAYHFTHLMEAHHEAALITAKQAQTRLLVDSGMEHVRLFLSQPEEARLQAGGIYDNPDRFRAQVVLQDLDARQRGVFSVVSPRLEMTTTSLEPIRYGLEDESSRLNLNTLLTIDQLLPGASRQLLMALPGMTEDVADAILDWMDTDDQPREYGAEVDYYSGLNPPYAPKNGPLETVEELLLVKGVTPLLLFGADINRNGQLDPHEFQQAEQTGASTDPETFRGWSAFLTLYSMEWNVNPLGKPRVYLNTNDLNKLVEDLVAVQMPEDWITFIVAYRQAGPAQTTGTPGAGNNPTGKLNMEYMPQFPIAQILSLVDATVNYTFENSPQEMTLRSPFSSASGTLNQTLPQLMDLVTVNPAPTIPGRININTCSSVILAGIPGMTPELLEQIIAARSVEQAAADPGRKYETWLLTEGIVPLQTMQTFQPLMTGGGNVYRAQIVGYFQSGQASSRAEVVFDATSPLPRVLFWRDITHLGRGYPLQMLGIDLAQ